MIDAVALRFAYVAGAKTTGTSTRIFIACASQNFPSLPRPHLKTGGRAGAGGSQWGPSEGAAPKTTDTGAKTPVAGAKPGVSSGGVLRHFPSAPRSGRENYFDFQFCFFHKINFLCT